MWALRLNNAMVINTEHISIEIKRDFSEHETFYLVSPHLNSINVLDSDRAYYRAKSLLILLNTTYLICSKIDNWDMKNTLFFNETQLYYFEKNEFDSTPYNLNNNLALEIEELENPFETELLYLNASVDFSKVNMHSILALSSIDNLVRECLMLFSLSNRDALYMLINVYKIVENIEYDIRVVNQTTPEDIGIDNALAPFKKGVLNHYINTKEGAGLFARHGAKTDKYTKDKPTHKEIIDATYYLLKVWLIYKVKKSSTSEVSE